MVWKFLKSNGTHGYAMPQQQQQQQSHQSTKIKWCKKLRAPTSLRFTSYILQHTDQIDAWLHSGSSRWRPLCALGWIWVAFLLGVKSGFLFTQRNQVARLQSWSRDLEPYNSQDTAQTRRCKEPKRAKECRISVMKFNSANIFLLNSKHYRCRVSHAGNFLFNSCWIVNNSQLNIHQSKHMASEWSPHHEHNVSAWIQALNLPVWAFTSVLMYGGLKPNNRAPNQINISPLSTEPFQLGCYSSPAAIADNCLTGFFTLNWLGQKIQTLVIKSLSVQGEKEKSE